MDNDYILDNDNETETSSSSIIFHRFIVYVCFEMMSSVGKKCESLDYARIALDDKRQKCEIFNIPK